MDTKSSFDNSVKKLQSMIAPYETVLDGVCTANDAPLFAKDLLKHQNQILINNKIKDKELFACTISMDSDTPEQFDPQSMIGYLISTGQIGVEYDVKLVPHYFRHSEISKIMDPTHYFEFIEIMEKLTWDDTAAWNMLLAGYRSNNVVNINVNTLEATSTDKSAIRYIVGMTSLKTENSEDLTAVSDVLAKNYYLDFYTQKFPLTTMVTASLEWERAIYILNRLQDKQTVQPAELTYFSDIVLKAFIETCDNPDFYVFYGEDIYHFLLDTDQIVKDIQQDGFKLDHTDLFLKYKQNKEFKSKYYFLLVLVRHYLRCCIKAYQVATSEAQFEYPIENTFIVDYVKPLQEVYQSSESLLATEMVAYCVTQVSQELEENKLTVIEIELCKPCLIEIRLHTNDQLNSLKLETGTFADIELAIELFERFSSAVSCNVKLSLGLGKLLPKNVTSLFNKTYEFQSHGLSSQ